MHISDYDAHFNAHSNAHMHNNQNCALYCNNHGHVMPIFDYDEHINAHIHHNLLQKIPIKETIFCKRGL